MSVKTKSVHNAYVLYDSDYVNRWYDAWGPDVGKYLQDFYNMPVDNTTGLPTEFVTTLVNASTITLADYVGGAALITAAGAENDGVSLQLGDAGGGESLQFNGAYPTYFGIQFCISDADQTDFLAGVCITDTALLGGMTDGLYFRSVDESAVLNFVLEKNSVETVTAVATLTDSTLITAEFYFDGAYVYAYIDGVLMATIAYTDASFPNDEALRLSVEFLDGEGVGNTCTLHWLRLIHVRY